LFTTTTAYQLFDPELHAEVEPDNLGDEDGELFPETNVLILIASTIPEIRCPCPSAPCINYSTSTPSSLVL
jgi:hypothetical protein